LSDRFPQNSQSLLELSQWLLPEYWGLNAAAMEIERQAAAEQKDVTVLCKELAKLGSMFATEKEILNDEDVACKVPPSSTQQSLFVTWVGRTAESSGSSAASCRTISISCLTD
jgi:hypothetical protein